jgi:hypothetical protein
MLYRLRYPGSSMKYERLQTKLSALLMKFNVIRIRNSFSTPVVVMNV